MRWPREKTQDVALNEMLDRVHSITKIVSLVELLLTCRGKAYYKREHTKVSILSVIHIIDYVALYTCNICIVVYKCLHWCGNTVSQGTSFTVNVLLL